MNGLFHDITRRMFMVFYFCSDYGLTSKEDLIIFMGWTSFYLSLFLLFSHGHR